MIQRPLPPIFAAVLAALVFGAAFIIDLPVTYNLDFFPVYGQVRGMLEGIEFYREAELYKWLATQYPTLKGDEVPPLAQPPWYYVSLFFLGFFELKLASKIWFGLNCALAVLSVYLITRQWPAKRQLVGFAAAFLYPPMVGHVVVGQFTMPVLLGIALLIWAARRESHFAFAAGLFLTTFKPHLGLIPFAVAVAYLSAAERAFLRAVSLRFIFLFVSALVITFAIDGGWILRYPEALARVGARPGNVLCDTCISLTYYITQAAAFDGRWRWIFGFGGIGLALVSLSIAARRKAAPISLLLSAAALCALIFNPYVRNYDALLALPAFYAIESAAPVWRWRLVNAALYALSFWLVFGRQRGESDQILWLVMALLLGVISFLSVARYKRP